MGVGTILEARQIFLLAFGEGKAPVLAQAVEHPISKSIAASFLQEHDNAKIVLDEAAARTTHTLSLSLGSRRMHLG